jgi:hypothetical protein
LHNKPNGETRRAADFAPCTVPAAAWQTFYRSQNSKGWSAICAASRTKRCRVVIQLNRQRAHLQALPVSVGRMTQVADLIADRFVSIPATAKPNNSCFNVST